RFSDKSKREKTDREITDEPDPSPCPCRLRRARRVLLGQQLLFRVQIGVSAGTLTPVTTSAKSCGGLSMLATKTWIRNVPSGGLSMRTTSTLLSGSGSVNASASCSLPCHFLPLPRWPTIRLTLFWRPRAGASV